jgi:response regulator RpfG family c-di-GMP phosphodiesterase
LSEVQAEQPLKILYIEEDPIYLLMMAKAIEACDNVELKVAPSAENGWIQAQHWQADWVCVDLNLPGIQGVDLVKKLHTLSSLNHSLFYAISTQDQIDALDPEEKRLFHGFISKPVEIDAIIELVRRIKIDSAKSHVS